jgi:hypothetical protein
MPDACREQFAIVTYLSELDQEFHYGFIPRLDLPQALRLLGTFYPRTSKS